MKKGNILILGLLAVVLAFVSAGCSDNNQVDPPFSGDLPPVTKVIPAQNISETWSAINAAVWAEGKNVILDLSDCWADNNAISGELSSPPSGNAMNIIMTNRFIKGIILPSTLVTIGDYAFRNCGSLTGVVIPPSVTSIGNSAFYGCFYLTGVTIPAGVTSIGYSAFSGGNHLTAITVDSNNANYSSDEGGVLFNKNKTTLIQYPAGKSGAYTIPSSVTSIGTSAFWFCRGLTGVVIPPSVTSIGDSAFGYCGLTGVTIPASVTTIGSGAFSSCDNLTNITVNDSNPNYSSQDGVLFDKNNTTLIQYPAVKSGAYTIPAGVTSIGDNAFYWCRSLASVTIPAGVTTIGASAFLACGLTAITIPSSVTSIGDYAFYDCDSLAGVTFEGTISSSNFSSNDSFPGDLRAKYLAAGGGAGAYTRTGAGTQSNPYVWTKQ